MKDFYALLGVPENVPPETLREARRKLLVQLHRYHALDFADRMAEIRAAYDTLSDPAQRDAYDKRLRAQRAGFFDDGALLIRHVRETHAHAARRGDEAVARTAPLVADVVDSLEREERARARARARAATLRIVAASLILVALVVWLGLR